MEKSASKPGIELIELTKSFEPGSVRAVTEVSLTVARGEIFGLIGANGSGKTTLLKLAAGLLRPSAGRVRLAGVPFAEKPLKAKKLLGYAAAEPLLYERMTAGQYLAFIANAFALGKSSAESIKEIAAEFGLADELREPIGNCPPGLKQRLSLASVFLHDPEVIILDEPWANLDPRAARLVKQKLKDAAGRGRAILFATHFLDIAQRTAGRLGIMKGGRLAAAGTFTSLKKLSGRQGATLETVFMELSP
jgi:ABC-2 type transport system ATP-binding protein